MKKYCVLFLLLFTAGFWSLSFAGSTEDNYIKRIDRDIAKMEKFASGEKKMNPSQIAKSFPRKIKSHEKNLAKLKKKGESGERFQSKLNEYKALFEKAKNASLAFDQEKLSMLKDDDVAFAENAYDFLRENGNNISAQYLRYTTPFSQLSAEALLNSLQAWPQTRARIEALVASLQPALKDDAVRTLLMKKSQKTVQLIDLYPRIKSMIDRFPTQAAQGVDEEIARMNQAIAKTKAETFKEAYYNGYVGESTANKAVRAMINLADGAAALGTDNANALQAKVAEAKKHYTTEKNLKVKDVINRNTPAKDDYKGADVPAIKAFAKKEFARQVGLPVLRVSILSKKWNRLRQWTWVNGVWTKRIYAVMRVTSYAKIDDKHAGEFQGFMYMNKDDELTDYEVASYEKGKSVPPSNMITLDKF